MTTDPNSGISFFAGQTDDPFFFDVPGELQFRNSLVDAVAAAGGPGSPAPPPTSDPAEGSGIPM